MVAPTNALDPVCGMTVDADHAAGWHDYHGQPYFFCSTSCLQRFRADPEHFLHAGHTPAMPEPLLESPAPGSARQYICPMDPDVVNDRPGPCPKCGMALEPKDVPVEVEADPEHAAMLRRLWIALALAVPVVVLAMGEMAAGPGRWISPWHNGLVQCVLTTIVVFYCGAPFFQAPGSR